MESYVLTEVGRSHYGQDFPSERAATVGWTLSGEVSAPGEIWYKFSGSGRVKEGANGADGGGKQQSEKMPEDRAPGDVDLFELGQRAVDPD